MNIYEFKDYRLFLENWIKSQPKKGRGILKKWAEELRVHTTFMSQVLNGHKDFSLEAATELGQLLGLSENEADYFFLLVLYEKAGSEALKRKIKKKIEVEKEKSKNISERLKVETELSNESKSIFYSSWIYSAIRNLIVLPEYKNASALAQKLNLPREVVQEAIEFLLKSNLIVYENKILNIGPQRTHVGADSPFVQLHHKNWRIKSFDQMLFKKKSDLFFTFPMSLSGQDAEVIRRLLPKWIEEVHKIVGPSESEVIRCLNIDYFEY